MCGINGVIYRANESSSTSIKDVLNKMNHCVIHRGPDDDGFFIHRDKNYHVGMAMRRLSIIDLQSGTQPIFNKNKSLSIVFNGEIYNYKQLKFDLEKEGVVFKTESDTEVILKLFELRGIEAFAMLDGMFAFSIFDKKSDKVYIVRDFFGEKPLYYTFVDNKFLWGSELKSIQSVEIHSKQLSSKALNLYFQLGYIPSPYCIFEGINKLNSNHFIEFDCNSFNYSINKINHKKTSDFNIENKHKAIQLTKELVYESVKSRSVSDVPVGTFLSGGVDSSIVSLCLSQQQQSKIDTFSIGFEKKSFDESEKAKVVAQIIGSKHHEFVMGSKEIIQSLDEILLNFDEPFADSSSLAGYFVSNKTKDYVKVALTGDGGDEIFGGYNKYLIGKMNQFYTRFVPEKLHRVAEKSLKNVLNQQEDKRGFRFKVKRLIDAIDYQDDFYYKIIRLGFQEQEMASFLNSNYILPNVLDEYKTKIKSSKNSLYSFKEIDYLISLEGDILTKVDRTSMLNSLECRAPFLSKKLWDFSMQLPEKYLINKWDKKHILKEAFKPHFPSNFLNKSKKGFRVPVGDWLKNELKCELLSYSTPSFVKKQAIFNFRAVESLVQNHINSKIDATFKVWTYYCFQKWYCSQFTSQL